LRNRHYRQLSREGYLITVCAISQYPTLTREINKAESVIHSSTDCLKLTSANMRALALKTKKDAIDSALSCFSTQDRLVIESRFFDGLSLNRIDGCHENTASKICKRFVFTVANMLGEE